MTIATVIAFVNVFFAGMLAGMEFVVHYGMRAPAEVLDEPAQLQFRQALVLRLRVLIPAFFLPTALSALAVMALDRAVPSFWYRCVALLALLIWIAIRVVGTVPVNSATLTWNPAAPPRDWKARVDHAERFHVLGVWVVVAAFALSLAALALELTAT